MQQPQLDGHVGELYATSSRLPLDIVGSNNFGRYQKISVEQTFNMVMSDNALVNFAGYELVAQIGGTSRGVYNVVIPNKLAAAIDNGFFLINPDNTFIRGGTLKTSTGNVYFADNNASQICFVDGVWVYVYTYNVTPATFVSFQIPSAVAGFDFIAPVYITYQDERFIIADGNTNNWFISQVGDGTIWAGDPTLPFANGVGEIQTKPAKAMAAVALSRELLVFGQTFCEPWYDAGLQIFPYQRDNFTAIDFGLVNQSTIGVLDNTICWLGINEKSNISVFSMYLDNQPQRISNDGLDLVLQQLTNPSDCYGFMFREAGHAYYQLTFVTDNLTYLFDLSAQSQSGTPFYTLTDQNMNYHIARRVVYFNGSNHFISLVDGNLYKMNTTITNYNGKVIPRIRTMSNIRYPDSARVLLQNINLTMESGINDNYDYINNGPLANTIDLALSEDGGYTFYNIGRQQMRRKGKRKNQVNFYNLGGASNDDVLRIRFNTLGRVVCTGGMISFRR